MEWICYILKEASSDDKNVVRRWWTRDQMLYFYGTGKYNVHGSFMTFLSLKGESRKVIILSELAINVGWRDIAFEIECFINSAPQQRFKQPPKLIAPYAKVVGSSKWQKQPQVDGHTEEKAH